MPPDRGRLCDRRRGLPPAAPSPRRSARWPAWTADAGRRARAGPARAAAAGPGDAPRRARRGSSKPRRSAPGRCRCPPSIRRSCAVRRGRWSGTPTDFRYRHYAAVRRLPVALADRRRRRGRPRPSCARAALASDRLRPGDGPSAEKRAKSWFTVRFVGEGGGRRVFTEVAAATDTTTAKMFAEAALCLAFRRPAAADGRPGHHGAGDGRRPDRTAAHGRHHLPGGGGPGRRRNASRPPLFRRTGRCAPDTMAARPGRDQEAERDVRFVLEVTMDDGAVAQDQAASWSGSCGTGVAICVTTPLNPATVRRYDSATEVGGWRVVESWSRRACRRRRSAQCPPAQGVRL
ncbi:hypothetical protein LT493_00085 [Streptomyces tricolor]|nr:hypothetical protein [Streptomyces tricolor]